MGTGKHCGGLKAGTGTCYRAEDQGRDVWGKWWRSFHGKPSSHLVWEELWGRIPSDKPVKRLGKIMVCGPSQKDLALGALLRGGGITMAQRMDWMVSGLGLGLGLGSGLI